SYSNLGPKWTFDWMAWVTDGGNPDFAQVYVRGGGLETYTPNRVVSGAAGVPTDTYFFYHHFMSHAELVAIRTQTSSGNTDVYERHLPDGSKEVYSLSDGARRARRIFLTAIVDAAGNQMKI